MSMTSEFVVENWQRAGFGLYVHWPFCQSKCPYCDFNSHVASRVDYDMWRGALLSELKRVGAQTPDRTLRTIFFGGGTPSLMPPDLVGDIISAAMQQWNVGNSMEVTLEANPSSVEAGRFQGFRDAGVNRISMGYQAMNDYDLRLLGRLHTATEGRKAFDTARKIFDRVSFDLIYARQDQSVASWRKELSDALRLAVDHLSLYQLTIEENTPFSARLQSGGLRGLPDEELAAELFEVTQELCDAAGMPAYEISNHARPGAEAKHNLIYWNGGDYAAIGPGSHGRLTFGKQRVATEAIRHPDSWLKAVRDQGSGDCSIENLSRSEQGIEYVLNAMRMAKGMNLVHLASLLNCQLSDFDFRHLEELGVVRRRNDQLYATSQGRLVLNAILADICTKLPEADENLRV